MSPVAVFGINNNGLNLAVNLLLLFLAVLWMALVFWTYMDARRRIADPMLVACATAASLFPFIGTIVYMIVRPPEYIEDVRERELEIAAAEARLANIEQLGCPYCGFEIEKSFLRCPSCLRRLKEPCSVCARPLDPRWKICPYCEAEVGAGSPAGRSTEAARRTRPRRTTRPPEASGDAPRATRAARQQADGGSQRTAERAAAPRQAPDGPPSSG
jgi:hypothetical protein